MQEQLSLETESNEFDSVSEAAASEIPKQRSKRQKGKGSQAGEQQGLTEILQKIVDVEYSEIMSKSYIDYSMSVITDRAIPDVRDGLKPVQRRILYDMNDLGVSSDKPYRKVARIVGDTMGRFHAHGLGIA